MMTRLSTTVAAAVLPLLLTASPPMANAIRSHDGIYERRNLARGLRSSHRNKDSDNIFLRINITDTQVGGCICDGRRTRLLSDEIGTDGESDCSCEVEDSSKGSGKGSSKGSGKGSGKGSSKGSSGKGSKSRSKGTSKSSKSSKSQTESDATKGSKQQGRSNDTKKSKGNDGSPTTEPVPTNPPGITPMPTSPPTDSSRIPPSAKPTNQPTNGQKPPPKEPVCGLDANGLYGQKVGISTEFRFLYKTQTIPGITKEELNVDMIPKLENQMGLDLLPKLFPDECVSPGTVATRSAFGGSQRRQLQLTSLNGMSIKPRDTVYEDGQEGCDGVNESIFPCFVIEGFITLFSGQNLNQIQNFQIENIISSVVSSPLASTDSRFLTVTFDQFLEERPSELRWYEIPLEWFRNAPIWQLILVALGGVIVLILLLLCCIRCCRRRKQRKVENADKKPPSQKPPPKKSSMKKPQEQQKPSIPTDIEQVMPNLDENDGNNNRKGYQISQSLKDPIVEERQEDLSTTGGYESNLNQATSNEYNGVSYEDNRIYPSSSDENFMSGGTDSEDYSRSLSRHNQDYRNPVTSPDYSSDINSAQPVSYREEIIEDDDEEEDSFEDVEDDDEYEIVYTSKSGRHIYEEEVFDDENDPVTSNSNSNSNMINSNSGRSFGSNSKDSDDDDVPFVGNTHLQEPQSSSFDMLRTKWES